MPFTRGGAGSAGALVTDESAEQGFDADFAGWLNVTVDSGGDVTNSSWYYIMARADINYLGAQDTGDSQQSCWKAMTYGNAWDDPLNPSGYPSEAWSLFANYTIAGVGQNVTEILQETITGISNLTDSKEMYKGLGETAGASWSMIDQKEKLVNYGESSSVQSETVTQIEGAIELIEIISETGTITAVLYIVTEIATAFDTGLAGLAFGVLGFVVALFAIVFVLSRED